MNFLPVVLLSLVLGAAQAAPPLKTIDKAEAAFEKGDFAAALALAKPLAVKGGEPRAMVMVGQMQEKGLAGLKKDPEAALKLYRMASAAQLSAGRYHLARAYREGIGIEKDPEKALRLAQAAADSDYPAAQALLGLMYSRGEGTNRDYAQAVSWYEKAASLGDPEAQYSLGFMYTSGVGLPKQLGNATRFLRMAADRGHPQAQNMLGLLLWSSGQGIARDPVEAYALLTLAAENGVADAAAKLAEYRPQMPPAQVTEALKRARAMAEEIRLRKLGRFAPKPKAPPKPRFPIDDAREAFDSGKYAKSRELSLPLAEKGDLEALYLLGLLYERGLGVAKDLDKGFNYTKRSAEGGYAPAMYNLGVMYEPGRPAVSADLMEAFKWYSIAGARGDEDAFDKTKSVGAKLKEDQMLEAKQRTKDWLLEHKKAAPPPQKPDSFQEFSK